MSREDARNSIAKTTKTLLELPRIALRNRDLITSLLAVPFAPGMEAKKMRLHQVYARVWDKVLKAGQAQNASQAKGAARDLLALPWVDEHLRKTPHFGALQPLVAPLNPSRLQYVSHQLSLTLELKELSPGLGLSSDCSGLLGMKKQSLTGLELLQCWSILLSVGHLFGTFATERALGYELRHSHPDREAFLEALGGASRPCAERIVDRGDMNELVGAIAHWRVATAAMPSELRTLCANALVAYHHSAPDDRLQRLIDLHRRIRQVAYQQLQALCSIIGLKDHLHPQLAFALLGASAKNIIEDHQLGFDAAALSTSANSRILSAIDDFQQSEFFASPVANALVLLHMEQFWHWWRSDAVRDRAFEERLAALLVGPSDWPQHPIPAMDLVARLVLPRKERQDWVKEFDDWRGNEPNEAWQGANLLLTQIRDAYVLDVFRDAKAPGMPAAAVASIARGLASRVQVSGSDAQLSRSAARFVVAHLQMTLRENLSCHLDPVPTNKGMSFCIVGRSVGELHDEAQRFARETRVQQRALEIDGMRRLITTVLGDEDPAAWFLITAKTQIFRRDKPADPLNEIDGACLLVYPNKLVWVFAEVKVKRQPGALGQLVGLAKSLAISPTAATQLDIGDSKAAWYTVTIDARSEHVEPVPPEPAKPNGAG